MNIDNSHSDILYQKDKNEEFNFLDINRYNDSVNNMNSYSIQCNCGCKGSCIKYGKYERMPLCLN